MTFTPSEVARLGGLAVHQKRGPRYAAQLSRKGWKSGASKGRPRLSTYDEIAATAQGRRLIRRFERMFEGEPVEKPFLRSSGR